MKYIRYMVLFISCACSFILQAQDTYLWLALHGNDVNNPFQYHMYDYDLISGDAQLLFTIDSSQLYHDNLNGRSMRIESFDFSPDGQNIILLEQEGDLYNYSLANDQVTYLQDVTPENIDFLWYGYTSTSSINQLNDSLYYISGNTLGLYNANSNVFEKRSQPPDLFTAQSNLEWYLKSHLKVVHHKDRWITVDGEIFASYIDPFDPEEHQRAMSIDLAQYDHVLSPIISYTYDCDSTSLLIIKNRYDNSGQDSIEIDILDIENNEIRSVLVHPGILPPGSETNTVFEVKHFNNPTWISCQRKIDLDEDNSTVAGIDFLLDSLCLFENIPLSDLDIGIYNEDMIDSIVVNYSEPLTDVTIPNGNYLTLQQPNKFVLINNGSTSKEDLENVIRGSYLTNNGNFPEIILTFTVWSNGETGESALAILRFLTPVPVAGDDISREYCEGDPSLTLENILAPNADTGGIFLASNNEEIFLIPDYQAPVVDTIFYIVSNSICFDTSQIINIVNSNPEIESYSDTVLCADGILDLDLTFYTDNLTWENDSSSKIRQITESGIYSYEIRNIFGCTNSDSFAVEFLPPPEIERIEPRVCEGEVFTFLNQSYTTTDLYQDTLQNLNGCDSIVYQIDFDFHVAEEIELEGVLSYCEGDEASIEITSNHINITIDGISIENQFEISSPGNYLISGYDSNNCYQELEISIVEFQNPEVFTVDLLDTIFNNEIILKPEYFGDIVSYLWNNSQDLGCQLCPEPQLISNHDNQYIIEVEDSNGCIANGVINVSFKSLNFILPTVISNNPAMEENGVLFLEAGSNIRYTLQVFDRWGNLLYNNPNLETNNSAQGWRPAGRYTSGVYVYKIIYTENNMKKIILGDIALL